MMGIEKKVLQTKGRDNLFSNITAINIPNLKTEHLAGAGGFQFITLAEPEKKTPRHVITINKYKNVISKTGKEK
jgi:hypothetical protein